MAKENKILFSAFLDLKKTFFRVFPFAEIINKGEEIVVNYCIYGVKHTLTRTYDSEYMSKSGEYRKQFVHDMLNDLERNIRCAIIEQMNKECERCSDD